MITWIKALWARYVAYTLNQPDTMPLKAPVVPAEPVIAPTPTIPTPVQPEPVQVIVEPNWNTRRGARKETRILCDSAGLTFQQKNDICACIFQESGFLTNPKPNQNKDKATGEVWSTDYGIVQVNTYFNIGVGKEFASVEEVLTNPSKCVQWMINTLKSTGELQPWASWTTGAYKQWLPAVSTDDTFDALLTKLNLLG